MEKKLEIKKENCDGKAYNNNSVDKEVCKLKVYIKQLGNNINKLENLLSPILPTDFSTSPMVDCLETKGKLDSELFNVNQEIETIIENIINMQECITMRGEFDNE